jgi:porphobilinogen deaminase
MVSSIDGKRFIKEFDIASLNKAEQLGLDIAEKMLSNGADKIIQEALKMASNIHDDKN